ncbi:hypothetical protein MLD38_039358 [Melastoma candidum]|uniref:Uncharacterized protein n=1 Tax=Melastoma candidum TaxID=119954 RepID=A0ACB9L465_9MYRT|nr:hypothetical protein MLD38_039358 [Melastoma candidum]
MEVCSNGLAEEVKTKPSKRKRPKLELCSNDRVREEREKKKHRSRASQVIDMAFLNKVGNILKQTASRQMNGDLSSAKPFIYQALRFMSSSKLFVGGLSYGTDQQGLREAFSKYGEVIEARVIMDRETGRSRGFGFITYVSTEEASSAIQALDGQDLQGRRIRVNYAADRQPRFQSGYGGGDSGYGGGGYGYGGENESGRYSAGGGGSFSGGGGFGGGGNYNSDIGGQGYGGSGSFNSPGNAGGYGADTGYGSASNSGFGGSYNSVAGGAGDSFTGGSNFSGSGQDGGSGMGFSRGEQQFDHNPTAGGYGQDDKLDGNYKYDDDEPNSYAKQA